MWRSLNCNIASSDNMMLIKRKEDFLPLTNLIQAYLTQQSCTWQVRLWLFVCRQPPSKENKLDILCIAVAWWLLFDLIYFPCRTKIKSGYSGVWFLSWFRSLTTALVFHVTFACQIVKFWSAFLTRVLHNSMCGNAVLWENKKNWT